VIGRPDVSIITLPRADRNTHSKYFSVESVESYIAVAVESYIVLKAILLLLFLC
jgi:hypothetical protein